MAVLVPHFSFPFRFIQESGVTRAAVNEQNSYDEIFDAILVAASFPVGWFEDDPDFGITDQTFAMPRYNTDLLRSEIIEQEPRASEIISERPDLYDALTTRIAVEVFSNEEG